MFVIPFVFALYPEILLIEAAVIDPVRSANGAQVYLAGYDGQTNWTALVLIFGKTALALYLLASSLAVMIVSFNTTLQIAAIAGAVIMIVWHATSKRQGVIQA